MKLNRVLANKPATLTNLDLQCRHCFTRFNVVILAHAKSCHVEQRFRLLMLHEHIYHTVLQHLKLSNWLPELFAGLTVFNRRLVQHFHCTHCFCTNGKNTVVNPKLKQPEAFIDFTQNGASRHRYVVQVNFRSLHAVNCRVIAFRYPSRRSINQKHCDSGFILLVTGCPCRNNQQIC